MIVTCPSCSTRYLVDPRALGSSGRTVRCANCANTWHQEPAADLPRTLEVVPDEFEPRPGPPRYPPPALPPRRRPWAMIALAAAAVVLLIGVAGVLARDSVMARWPGSTRLYATVGLGAVAPGAGLELRNVSPRRDLENGMPVLIIEGEVANATAAARDVPKLKVILRDHENNELQNWIFSASEPRVLPGATVPFRTIIPQPSGAAAGVVVTFAESG
jgi:predicted Zn finger-like uncharacterized protein